MKRTIVLIAISALVALPAMGGEWHSGANNLCTDCHTMHFSMQHNWDGSTPVPTTPAADGNWLGATGPNHYLLKLPANELCLTCHNGQSFAPDVFELNFNASPTAGRMAGALNNLTSAAPYETYKGHTLDTTDLPPGYDPGSIGPGNPYPAGTQLECINCHAQHGPPASYRNLGPFGWGFPIWSQARPTYEISLTQDSTKDVQIYIDPLTYTPNSGSAATFNPYYDYANIAYNRVDGTTSGGNLYANTMENVCGTCHGGFHGGPEDANVEGVPAGAGFDEFIRHPSSIIIGLLGGGHSSLDYYANPLNVSKVKVYADNQTTWGDASPGCVTCHKAHGNQNPFGMFFLSATAAAISEEGGYAVAGNGVIGNEMANGYGIGYQNLCGQCHTQGINYNE